ncbi:threonine ammonia-lyase [bacterium]|nr:threonine ammonia-lyase [bacterium]
MKQSIPLSSFQKAAEHLKGVLNPTSLIYSEYLSEETSAKVYIKPECLQRTGAFKIRGAYHKIMGLSEEQLKKGIVTASAGNHAQGVALAAKMVSQTLSEKDNFQQVRAIIVMPETTPLIKVEATEKLGAEVVLFGNSYDEAYSKACEIRNLEGTELVHPFDDLDIITGQGTIGLEILEEHPDVDVILVPVGGGGLLAGITQAVKAINPQVKVIGVEPNGAACMKSSIEKNSVVTLPQVDTIADGVAVAKPGETCFQLVKNTVDSIITVSDQSIMESMLFLIERHKLICENAGALSIAGLSQLDLKGKKVVSVVSGGNIDVITISEMLNRGMVERGRLFSFSVELLHKPGELLKISQTLADHKANVIKLDHNQFRNPGRFKSVTLDVTVETNGREHVKRIVTALNSQGYEIETGF